MVASAGFSVIQSRAGSINFLAPFFILSISNTINFGNFVLLDISLPKFLYAPLSVIRASGRFIWPIYYLIFIAGLVLIYKKIKYKINNKKS